MIFIDDLNDKSWILNDEAIPNKHLGPSSAPTASSTTLGIGVSTPSSLQQPLHQQLATAVPSSTDLTSFNQQCELLDNSNPMDVNEIEIVLNH